MTAGRSGQAAEREIAQINIGRLIAAEGDPRVQPFFEALAAINAVADAAPGFRWRLQSDSGDATDLQPTPDPLLIVNMSVWESPAALSDFVYRTGHAKQLARRREYFQDFDGAFQALWWVEQGHVPSIEEGLSRLWMLDRFGPTQHAFTFRSQFPAPASVCPNLEKSA